MMRLDKIKIGRDIGLHNLIVIRFSVVENYKESAINNLLLSNNNLGHSKNEFKQHSSFDCFTSK